MGYITEHRGRRPNVVVPSTGQFLNSTCIRTNQSSEDIKYSAVLTERIRRQCRNTRTIGQHQGKEKEAGKRKDGKTTSESGPVGNQY